MYWVLGLGPKPKTLSALGFKHGLRKIHNFDYSEPLQALRTLRRKRPGKVFWAHGFLRIRAGLGL